MYKGGINLITYTDEEYEAMAICVIRDYKNKNFTDDEIRNKYPLVIKIAIDNIKKSLILDKNVKSETQGPRSKTYRDNIVIIDDVCKSLLGSPYVKMW